MPFIVGELGALLGVLKGADMNSTADQPIKITSGLWIPRRFVFANASLSLTTSVGGIYDATAKGGNALVSAAQVYSTLINSTRILDASLAIANRSFSVATIYLSLTVAQGAASTADLYVFGDPLV